MKQPIEELPERILAMMDALRLRAESGDIEAINASYALAELLIKLEGINIR